MADKDSGNLEAQRRELVAAQAALDFERTLAKRERAKLAEEQTDVQRRRAQLNQDEARLRQERDQFEADRQAFETGRFASQWDQASRGGPPAAAAAVLPEHEATAVPAATSHAPDVAPTTGQPALPATPPSATQMPPTRVAKAAVVTFGLVLLAAIVVWLLSPSADNSLPAEIAGANEATVEPVAEEPYEAGLGSDVAIDDAYTPEIPDVPDPDAAKAVVSTPRQPPARPTAAPTPVTPAKTAKKKTIDDLFDF